MAINIGQTEIRDIVLGGQEIDRVQIGEDTVFRRLTTQSFAQPIGGGLNWSTPGDLVGIAGDTIQNADFVSLSATADSNSIISGTPNLLGLPEGLLFTFQYLGTGTGNSLLIRIGGDYPTDNNDNISITVAGLGGVYPVDFLVIAGAGSGTSPGAGGLRTSWGTHSGGPAMVTNIGNGDGIANNVQAPAEEPIITVGGQTYNIVVGNSPPVIFPDPQPGPFEPNLNQAFPGNNSSITGTGVNITSYGGGQGSINSSNTFTSSRITRSGTPGGSGSGARTYSGNLSTVTASAGPGGADPDLTFTVSEPGHGYNGGAASSRNASAFGGSGGAGGAGSFADAGGGHNVSASNGLGLSNNITGNNIRYSGTNDDRSGNTNPGSASQDGLVVIRVPSSQAGTSTGATVTTQGSDTIFTWGVGNGTYTAYENLPPAPVLSGVNVADTGTPSNIICTANDPENGSITYSWYTNNGHNNNTITGNPVREVTNSNGSDVFQFNPISGNYTVICIANDGENSVLASHNIQFSTPITVTASGSSQNLTGGFQLPANTGNYLGASIQIAFRLTFDSVADAEAALPFVSSSAPIQPINGQISITQNPNARIQRSGNLIEVDWFDPNQYQWDQITTGSFPTTGSTNASVSIDLDSGYRLVGETSRQYMEYV